MLTMRPIDGQGFGPKAREWNSSELLVRWREQWAQRANGQLAEAGSEARIDHRTLAAQREEAMAQAAAEPHGERRDAFEARAAESSRRGRLRGRSVTTFLEWTGGNAFEENVTVTVAADGFIEIFSATQAMGQGIATSYAQLAVDVFGVPIDRIRILQGDTDRANGFGSAGSRSLFTGGSGVQLASEKTI